MMRHYFLEDLLKQEINEDREAHGKRPLKEKRMTTIHHPVEPKAKKKDSEQALIRKRMVSQRRT